MSVALRPLLVILALAACGQVLAEDGVRRASLREDAGARVRQGERDGGRGRQAQPTRPGRARAACGQVLAEAGVRRASLREDAGARVRQVERDGGRVLQAQPMRRGDRETYRIKVLTPEGRVRVLDTPRDPDPEPAARRERILPEEFPRTGNMLRERARAREAAERERV